ncbi:glutamate-binding protein precursor [Pseudonocardia sp. Ae406_Ps2]|uniref:glutamate ABC transporter substrate-binding protein n=1 Tax=unclassified Pseudonocardia TaxID=2619320 RepID=UPI00031A1B8F|nr:MULTISPECIES: glutamate ABC transporter substrate-binding protein [unclassified Pseudonocardia]OLL96367.1 glutamate-binding protein precursor [Pseudonocardia sp. Ae331_Ps2]OLM05923.1 glutamate-binding protein precursor [Pseudonocardia sp. Ae406_Ps2]OLM13515.1 glutamate-binding protein precursor [Pseudonocardia sp. Ae505_Ps2]OLM27501.1 glutamate-binding protein precursor [Pseudonocardia sp. Ae706_Ps2]OLM30656.1 glutamate-binding protein precursor [Pseudonocardia sp. Ae717_Ps2]
MRIPKTLVPAAALITAIALVATLGASSTTNPGITPDVVDSPTLAAGSTMKKIHDRGYLRIGTRYDHPGLSAGNLQGHQEGFEIDLGEYIAGRLGLRADQIQYVEASSANREQFLAQDKVDLVMATYSITDKRRKVVSFAGPYADIGLDLVVLKGNPVGIIDPQTPRGVRICSTAGGQVSATIRKEFPQANLIEFDVSSKCIDALKNGTVDALSTHGPIGAGYVSKDDEDLEMLGRPFYQDNWAVGIAKGDTQFCEWIDLTLQEASKDGSYARAWDASLGRYSKQPMTLPEPEPCS